MKKYCFTCGAKLEFSIRDKPKFCSKCGIPLESSAGPIDNDVEPDDEQLSVPINIDKLDFDFEEDILTGKGQTLGSIVGTLEESEVGRIPENMPKTTNEEAMEQFKKEAGSLRQGPTQKDVQT